MKIFSKDWESNEPIHCVGCTFGCRTLYALEELEDWNKAKCAYCFVRELVENEATVEVEIKKVEVKKKKVKK